MPNPNTPRFPSNVATDNDLTVASNRALSTLTLPIDGAQTSFTVADGSKFEVPCLVQIDTEILFIGAKSGSLLQNVTRGYALSSAASHGQNAQVKGYVFSYHHNQLAAEIKAIEAALGANLGNVVTQTDVAGGDLTNNWSHLALVPTGVTPGTYGGFNVNVQLHVRADGRIDSIVNSPGNRNYPIIYKGAVVQGTNAVLGFTFANSQAPNATVVDHTGGSGSLFAVARFTNGNAYWVQDHFYLPDDWVGDAITCDVYWLTTATTGNVTWTCKFGKLSPTDPTTDFAFFNAASVTTTVPGVAGTIAKSRITAIPTGSFFGSLSPGDELFFQFGRSASDTAAAAADMISIKFNINRDFSLVP